GGEIARAVAGKESDHARDLLGARHAPERNGGIELLELGGVFHSGKIDGRRYRARSHADDQDIVRRELDSGRARKHPHTALRETISRIAGHRPVLMDRTDIDNAAAIALLDHLFGSDLSTEKSAFKVNSQNPVKLILRRIEDGGARFDAGVVDHDV